MRDRGYSRVGFAVTNTQTLLEDDFVPIAAIVVSSGVEMKQCGHSVTWVVVRGGKMEQEANFSSFLFSLMYR
jgi:hypothetical protein